MAKQWHPGDVIRLQIERNEANDGARCHNSLGILSATATAVRFWAYVARMDEALLLALRSGLVDSLDVDWCDPTGPYPLYPECGTDNWVRFWEGLGKDKSGGQSAPPDRTETVGRGEEHSHGG